jgi:hypothetical protein
MVELLPIFFYNDFLNVGSYMSFNFFEPRYRLMISRIAPKGRFLYLPSNPYSYGAHLGDLGVVVALKECRIQPDGRAEVLLKVMEHALITSHWIEPDSRGLSYAYCRLLGVAIPSTEYLANLFERFTISADHTYTTVLSLEVFSSPEGPLIGMLSKGVVVRALDSHANWIRHSQGWSMRFIGSQVYLYPHQPLFSHTYGELLARTPKPNPAPLPPLAALLNAQQIQPHGFPSAPTLDNFRYVLFNCKEKDVADVRQAIHTILDGSDSKNSSTDKFPYFLLPVPSSEVVRQRIRKKDISS